ncbi:(d)CMP kinase [uncultured Eubacterium sp.]|uniref:(d)CMP kinase n=1 Tax=uncultured Eubacterium sp. TaxID=165185 RepID=UPI0025D5D0C4|nr:(d)CMP kinase [uncultured Eubacterium sp.]
MSFNIAIDGPAGAGKSTIAKKLAKKISFIYVDTGAMYRAMGYYFLQHGIQAEEEEKIKEACNDISVALAYENGVQKVLLNGEDISGKIRQEEVGNMASATSGYGFVREKLLSLQQDMAAKHNVIMDGRDIGTCVLPNAQLKIFLTASVEVRAKRRYDELVEKGEHCNLVEIEKDISERDYRDMHREIAPLKAAEDAVMLDSSNLNIDEVVEVIYEQAKKAGLKA